MKKAFSVLLAVLMLASLLTACGGESGSKGHTVTFYDGETVLKEVTVKDGETVENYVPEKEGYIFDAWYATPNFGHKFDTTTPITEDTALFGLFRSAQFQEDTREFFIVGSGRSPLLASSNWGNVITDEHKLQKLDNPNENQYQITLDLYVGDEFQFAINSKWENQRGAGYLVEPERDGVEYFVNAGSFLSSDSGKSNIKVAKDGNYTLTLTTHPSDDQYDTGNDYYSEETRENYNYNEFDTITWVYNGEPAGLEISDVEFLIKGSIITGWGHLVEDEYKMTSNGDGTYTYTHQFFAGDEFMFYTFNEDHSGLGALSIKADDVDAAASTENLELVPGANIKVLKNGTYSFTYDIQTQKAVVIYDEAFDLVYEPGDTWYIVGSGASRLMKASSWGNNTTEEHELTQVDGDPLRYSITLDLQPGDQFCIVGDKGVNWARQHSYSYVVEPERDGTVYFSDLGNIRVEVAGNYTLTLVLDPNGILGDRIEWVRNGDVLEKLVGPFDVFIQISSEDWAHTEQTTTDDGVAVINKFIPKDDAFCLVYFDTGIKLEDINSLNSGSLITYKEKGQSGPANDNFGSSDKDFLCNEAGFYKITIDFNSGHPVVDFEKLSDSIEFDFYIKGTMTSWETTNKATAVNGIAEMEYTFAVGDEFGFAYYLDGATEGLGNWVGAKNMGTEGDGNSAFSGDNNMVCGVAGTYRIVLYMADGTPVLNFYKK